MIASAIGIIYQSLRRYIKQTLEEQKTAKKEDSAQMQTVEKSREKEDSSSIWENYGKRLVSQLSDSDVEAMAGGHFDSKKSIFTYHDYSPKKLKMGIFSMPDFNKNPFYFREILSLPEKTKIVTISFEVIDKSSFKEISNLEIFVKKNGDYAKLSTIKEISLSCETDNPVEFYFDGLSKKFFEVDVYLKIKSFTL